MFGFAKNANANKTSYHNVQQITASAKVRLLVKQRKAVKIIAESTISKLTVLLIRVQPLIKIYLKD